MLIAVVGFQLRSVIVGVPPVLPGLRDDLHLSFSAAGALSAIPVLGLGAAAVPGALLVNRFGGRFIVGAGTIALGAAALLRLAPPVPAALFAFSALMALAVAVVQPSLVVIVRAWFPDHVQPAATAYATSLGLGGLGGAVVSVPLLALGGWRGSFVVWGGLAFLAGLLWFALAPGRGADHSPVPGGFRHLVRDPAVWHVAALFGSQSLVYYASATWIPFQLRGYHPGYLTLVLFLLNVVNLPLTIGLVLLRRPWATSRLFYGGAGVLMVTGSTGFMLGLTQLAWLWAALLSAAIGMTFSGATVLPALFARTENQVSGFVAIVLTAGYALSFTGPLLGGLLVDRTRILSSPFWLVVASALTLLALGLTLPRRPSLASPPPPPAPARTGSAPPG